MDSANKKMAYLLCEKTPPTPPTLSASFGNLPMENSDDKNGDNDHLTAKSSYWYNFPKKMMTRMTRMVMMIESIQQQSDFPRTKCPRSISRTHRLPLPCAIFLPPHPQICKIDVAWDFLGGVDGDGIGRRTKSKVGKVHLQSICFLYCSWIARLANKLSQMEVGGERNKVARCPHLTPRGFRKQPSKLFLGPILNVFF